MNVYNLIKARDFMPPASKKLRGAYWFGPVCLLCFAYGQEQLEIGSLICGISMKTKRTGNFFLFHRTCHCRVMPIFQPFSDMDFCIVNLQYSLRESSNFQLSCMNI